MLNSGYAKLASSLQLAAASYNGQKLLSTAAFASCDDAFGPFTSGCRGDRFDFTLFFEQTMFTILPSALFILGAFTALCQLWGRKPKVNVTTSYYMKMMICFFLIAIKAVLLTQWIHLRASVPAGGVSIAAAALNVADAVFLALLTNANHLRSPKPSTLLIAFLFFTTVLDGFRCRTLWLVEELRPLACAFSASLVAKTLLFVLEARSKRKIMIEDWNELGAEATSSIVGLLFMWWVNPILWIGNKAFLKQSDLPHLKPEMRARHVLPKMLQNWARYKDSGKYALVVMVLKTCKSVILIAAIPRLILGVCKLVVPFYIAKVILYVGKQEADPETDKAAGYGLIAGAILLFVGKPLVETAYEQAKGHMRITIRASLVSSVLHYGTQMEPGEKKGSAALTLITTDIVRIGASFYYLHEFWIAPFEVAFAIWLLAGQVGWGFVGPLSTIIFGGLISGVLAMSMGPAQKKVNEAIEKRISDTTTVLGSMKETKMLGLVDSWSDAIERLLDTQIRQSLAFRRILVLLNVAGKLPESLAPPITFGIAILLAGPGASLSIATAFTSLNIMFLIVGPIATMAHMYPYIIAALPCFVRVQEFISLCSAYEERVALLGGSSELPSSDALLPSFAEPIFFAENAAVITKSNEEPLIKNANISILPGTFNIVAGKIGTGKSVLLQALLGQLSFNGNSKVRTSNVAYCAQSPWITSGTAKQNIVGKSAEDEHWYRTVVTACGLDRDFDDFARGDQTTVGPKGVSLSGGQKQRMSLARGLFSRKSIIFVDDVLSGLDWATQRFVWDEVFGPSGLLRKHGITVVLATHALHLVDQVDSVIMLGDDGPGSIVQGTMDELKSKTKIQDLIATSHKSADDDTTANASSASSQKGDAEAPQGVNNEEMEKDLLRKTGDLSLYSYYLNMVGVNGALWFSLLVAVAAAWPILPQIWLMWWTEANESSAPVNTAYYFWVYTLLNILEIVVLILALYFSLLILAPGALKKIHTRLLRATMRAPLSFFVSTAPGDLINRFSRDIEQVDLDLPMYMTTSLMSVVWVSALMGMILMGSLYMAVFILPMIMFLYMLQHFYLRTSRQLRYLDLQSSAPLNTHIIEMIDGVGTVQAYGWESPYQATGMELLDQVMRANYMLRTIQNWLELVMNLFVSSISVMLIVVCILVPSSTSAGGLAVALTNVTMLGGSLSWALTAFTEMETGLGSVERIRTFENNTPREAPPVKPCLIPSAWPQKGALQIRDVTASYPAKFNSPAFRALNGVDINIQPGQKVAICGRSGSGKSSLLLTLFRLLDLDSGSITIDGIDITDVPQNVLRSRLIVVPQEPMLMPGSLRSNLLRTRKEDGEEDELDDEKLINHLKTVELWDMVEGQGGLVADTADLKLSQGQKQLVCMARALASKDESPILVLDEAMSTVDKQTEELMVKILEEQFTEHTIISVVHRLNTVEKFDTVLLLDAGAIAEVGSPETLLAKENGRFRALWHGKEA